MIEFFKFFSDSAGRGRHIKTKYDFSPHFFLDSTNRHQSIATCSQCGTSTCVQCAEFGHLHCVVHVLYVCKVNELQLNDKILFLKLGQIRKVLKEKKLNYYQSTQPNNSTQRLIYWHFTTVCVLLVIRKSCFQHALQILSNGEAISRASQI